MFKHKTKLIHLQDDQITEEKKVKDLWGKYFIWTFCPLWTPPRDRWTDHRFIADRSETSNEKFAADLRRFAELVCRRRSPVVRLEKIVDDFQIRKSIFVRKTRIRFFRSRRFRCFAKNYKNYILINRNVNFIAASGCYVIEEVEKVIQMKIILF